MELLRNDLIILVWNQVDFVLPFKLKKILIDNGVPQGSVCSFKPDIWFFLENIPNNLNIDQLMRIQPDFLHQ